MTQPSAHDDSQLIPFSWRNITLFLLTLGVVALCGMMLRPFLPAITGAIVLAVVTYHPYRWLESRLRRPTLAASISLLLVALCIIGPVAFILQSLGHHLLQAAHGLQAASPQHGVERLIQRSPRISQAVQYLSKNFDVNAVLDRSASIVGRWLASFFGGSIQAVYQVVILLFLLFFLYRDHARAVAALRALLPLGKAGSDYLLTRVEQTIRATVLGRFVVAGIQGLVAGITYALLGVPAASLLGIATALCALIPSFGAFFVWAPVAVWLAFTHHWVQAIILVAVGSLIISTLDNFLYPILVGNQIQLHTVVIFVSILGGVWLFGISGLVLGPILFTVAGSLLYLWREGPPLPGKQQAAAPQSS